MLAVVQEWQKRAKEIDSETLAQSLNNCQSLANNCLLLQQKQQQLETQLQKEQEKIQQQLKQLQENLNQLSGLTGLTMGKSLSAIFRKVFPKEPKENLPELKENVPELKENVKVRSNRVMIPINEQEFNTVSSLLKGKLTLDMVNKVYDIIFQYFEQHPKSTVLTPQQLSKLGIKPGRTSESKLKILRALGIIKIDLTNKVSLT